MNDEELKELIEKEIPSIPDIKIDSKKIIQRYEEEKKKDNKQILRLSLVLSSFVLIIIAVLSIVLFTNKLPSDVREINKRINNLDEIEDNETKIMEIMNLEKEVQLFSPKKKEGVYMDKLSYEATSTADALKGSVDWKDYLNMNNSYVPLENIINKNEVMEIRMIKGRYSSQMFFLSDTLFINGLFSLLDLPYIDIIDKSGSIYDEYKDVIVGDYRNEHTFYLATDNDLESIRIRVCDSGYVFIAVVERTGEDVYDVELEDLYISLIPLDRNVFLEYVSIENIKK